jgi:hypothetical protein
VDVAKSIELALRLSGLAKVASHLLVAKTKAQSCPWSSCPTSSPLLVVNLALYLASPFTGPWTQSPPSCCYAHLCCCGRRFHLCTICVCMGCCWCASNDLRTTPNLTDPKGHEMTGTIAQMYLHPSVLPRICSIVYPNGDPNDSRCHLGVLATWADRIRGIPQYRWAGAYHYVGGIGDWPPSKCRFGEEGWHGRDGVNVLGGIYNTTNWLRESKPGAGEATKFLVHFVGDLHQPMHLTYRERGGNGG